MKKQGRRTEGRGGDDTPVQCTEKNMEFIEKTIRVRITNYLLVLSCRYVYAPVFI